MLATPERWPETPPSCLPATLRTTPHACPPSTPQWPPQAARSMPQADRCPPNTAARVRSPGPAARPAPVRGRTPGLRGPALHAAAIRRSIAGPCQVHLQKNTSVRAKKSANCETPIGGASPATPHAPHPNARHPSPNRQPAPPPTPAPIAVHARHHPPQTAARQQLLTNQRPLDPSVKLPPFPPRPLAGRPPTIQPPQP